MQTEFGDPIEGQVGEYRTEKFHWRGFLRYALFRVHPSGLELISVMLTPYKLGQKVPTR